MSSRPCVQYIEGRDACMYVDTEELMPQPERVNDIQIGGDHYKQYGDFQPWDVFMRWNLNPYCSYLLPYLIRYREKGGIADLKKARHTLDKWIEEEERIVREERARAR